MKRPGLFVKDEVKSMSNIRTIFLVGLIAIGIVGCSSSDESAVSELPEGYSFRPIEEIIDTELEVTNFANDGTATLPIQTSIPVACTVVYGTTPEFGSLTLDQDMAGGTHSDHNPLLSGLEPETTYYFRTQGVDDLGNIYLSEVMTFTTPPTETSEAASVNLASSENGAEIIGYSSAFGGAEPAERWGVGSAFDDNPNTEWSSAGDGNDAWVEVELAQSALIDTVEFHSRAMGDGSAIALMFTLTADNGEVYGPFDLPDGNSPYTFDVDIEAKTLRFDLVETTGGNTGVVDIAVYGKFAGE